MEKHWYILGNLREPVRRYPAADKQPTRLPETNASSLVAENIQHNTIWRANMGETGGDNQSSSRWGKPLPSYEDC